MHSDICLCVSVCLTVASVKLHATYVPRSLCFFATALPHRRPFSANDASCSICDRADRPWRACLWYLFPSTQRTHYLCHGTCESPQCFTTEYIVISVTVQHSHNSYIFINKNLGEAQIKTKWKQTIQGTNLVYFNCLLCLFFYWCVFIHKIHLKCVITRL